MFNKNQRFQDEKGVYQIKDINKNGKSINYTILYISSNDKDNKTHTEVKKDLKLN